MLASILAAVTHRQGLSGVCIYSHLKRKGSRQKAGERVSYAHGLKTLKVQDTNCQGKQKGVMIHDKEIKEIMSKHYVGCLKRQHGKMDHYLNERQEVGTRVKSSLAEKMEPDVSLLDY